MVKTSACHEGPLSGKAKLPNSITVAAPDSPSRLDQDTEAMRFGVDRRIGLQGEHHSLPVNQ